MKNKQFTCKTALIFLGCILFFSCKSPKEIPIIDLNRIDQSISLDLADILKDISIVQIGPDFLLSTTDQIYVTSNYLIILINNESLHLFSRDGVHIRKLAERGNGPGEFYSIRYLFVDEDECILCYVDGPNFASLSRIDIGSGKVLEPLPIDFNFLMVKYINGKVYGLPSFRYAGRSIIAGTFPDSAIVACSFSLPSGEMEKYQGHHSYSYIQLGSTISSYYDEILLLNYDYSDTLFTLKGRKLSPQYVLHLSDKMNNTNDGGSTCSILFVYNKGIVLSKETLVPSRPPRPGVMYSGREFFALLDRNGNVFKIDNILVMGAQINIKNSENPWILPSLLPVTCGKYGYMLVDHDFFEARPANFDPNNDNPIIIVGILK